mmetsp:Transcript_7337/g.18836  ORF Transcript_7337/g.18836 Transcript_7337/m.18836 type:complete len:204 (+) Transcript_7337:166-777(+)
MPTPALPAALPAGRWQRLGIMPGAARSAAGPAAGHARPWASHAGFHTWACPALPLGHQTGQSTRGRRRTTRGRSRPARTCGCSAGRGPGRAPASAPNAGRPCPTSCVRCCGARRWPPAAAARRPRTRPRSGRPQSRFHPAPAFHRWRGWQASTAPTWAAPAGCAARRAPCARKTRSLAPARRETRRGTCVRRRKSSCRRHVRS